MLKRVRKFAWIIACIALVFGAASCSDPEDPAAPAESGPAAEQPGDNTGTGNEEGGSGTADDNTGTGGGENPSESVSATIKGVFADSESIPALTGSDGVFTFAAAEQKFSAGIYTEEYKFTTEVKSMSYTGDDSVKNGTTSTGMIISSSLIDGIQTVSFDADALVANMDYTFTLAKAAAVSGVVKAFNTQSSSLKGKVEILPVTESGTGAAVLTQEADSGSKSANDVEFSSASELAAGTYCLRFSWVTAKAMTLKKITCGVSEFSLTATAK